MFQVVVMLLMFMHCFVLLIIFD